MNPPSELDFDSVLTKFDRSLGVLSNVRNILLQAIQDRDNLATIILVSIGISFIL